MSLLSLYCYLGFTLSKSGKGKYMLFWAGVLLYAIFAAFIVIMFCRMAGHGENGMEQATNNNETENNPWDYQ